MFQSFNSSKIVFGLSIPVVLSSASCVNAADPTTPVAPAPNPGATVVTSAKVKPTVRIVATDAQVRSRKRGVGANKLDAADFKAIAPGVSWYYNWHFQPGDIGVPPKGAEMEFIPMVWGKDTESLTGLEKYLAAGNKPRQILGINEPNLSEQAFMSPQQAAELYAKIKVVTDKYKVPLAGPQMSIGSPPNMSITAMDPVENKELTYTYMMPYLKAFFHYAEKAGTEVESIGIHPYMNAGGLSGLTALTAQEFKKPIWVTEFNISDESAKPQDALTYIIQATDFMERQPYVHGYAFFKERLIGHPNASLLAAESGKLTPLGEAYVKMPVHDADVYYRVPGRLQAENYVTLDKMEIWPTKDVDGFTHLSFNAPGSYADYNVQVDKAGKYKLRFRMIGEAGNLSVLNGDKVLSSFKASPADGKWDTVETTVNLPAGTQTLRVRAEIAGQALNWIEFAKA